MRPMRNESLLRRLTRPLLVLLAVIFLIEAWLWDRLAPIAARLIAALPLESLKADLAERIKNLPPYGALVVFLSPLSLGIPVKCGELWFLAHGYWISFILLFLAAKLVGVGLLAFIFEHTRDQLQSMRWFAALYRATMWAYRLSHELVAPIKAEIAARLGAFRGKAKGEFACFVKRLRRRSLAAWRSCTFTAAG